MTQIAHNYATTFRMERIQQYINYTDYYTGMAQQLCLVAEHYSSRKTELIFMGYVEVVRLLESLAALHATKSHKPEHLTTAKRAVYKALRRCSATLRSILSISRTTIWSATSKMERL